MRFLGYSDNSWKKKLSATKNHLFNFFSGLIQQKQGFVFGLFWDYFGDCVGQGRPRRRYSIAVAERNVAPVQVGTSGSSRQQNRLLNLFSRLFQKKQGFVLGRKQVRIINGTIFAVIGVNAVGAELG